MFDFGNFHHITEKYFVLNECIAQLQVIFKFSTTEHIKCLVQIAMGKFEKSYTAFASAAGEEKEFVFNLLPNWCPLASNFRL